LNRDGLITDGESGIPGVKVRIQLPNDPTIGYNYGTDPTIPGITVVPDGGVNYAETETLSDGTYSFPQLPIDDENPYTLNLRFLNPNTSIWEFTDKDAGGGTADEAIDSDADPTTGLVEYIDPISADAKVVNAGLRGLQYIVTFKLNYGANNTHASITVTRPATTLASLPSPPERDCYTFSGWYDTSDATSGNEFTTSTTVDGSREVFARWSQKHYRVTYSNAHATSGSPPPPQNGVPCGSDFTPCSGCGTLKRTGYYIDGWSLNDGEAAISSIDDIHKSETLYPHWVKRSYDFTFDSNGGTGAMLASGIQIGGKVPINAAAAAMSREGYNLLGFSTSSTATKAEYRGDFTLSAAGINRMTANDTLSGATLYAVWKIIEKIERINIIVEMANWACRDNRWDTNALITMKILTNVYLGAK
jgi:uncharacterized repeat protein (TIGR02543 family)